MQSVFLSKKSLLYVYAIIPFCFLLVGLDALFFKGLIKAFIPQSFIARYISFNFLAFIHIVASFFVLIDPEPLVYHKNKLAIGFLLITVAVVFSSKIFAGQTYFIFLIVFNLIHVIGQQLGLARLFINCDKHLFNLWRLLYFILSLGVYMMLFYPNQLQIIFYSDLIHYSVVLSFVSVAVLSFFISRGASAAGKLYILGNFLMVVSTILFFKWGYSFFALIILRAVHDIVAFLFYINHSKNKMQRTHKNLFYNIFGKLKINSTLLYIVFASVIAYLFTIFYSTVWVWQIFMIMTLFHYYTEGFMWKAGSPAKEYVFLKT